MYDNDSGYNFENPYHNHALLWEKHHGDLEFKVDLSEYFGTMLAMGFVDWLQEVERIFFIRIYISYEGEIGYHQVERLRICMVGADKVILRQIRSEIREKMKKKIKVHFFPFGDICNFSFSNFIC